MAEQQHDKDDREMPSTLYLWIVPSAAVLEQPGSWRIRKWDTEPFPEATHTAVRPESGPNNAAGQDTALQREEVVARGDTQGSEVPAPAAPATPRTDAALAECLAESRHEPPIGPLLKAARQLEMELSRAESAWKGAMEERDYYQRKVLSASGTPSAAIIAHLRGMAEQVFHDAADLIERQASELASKTRDAEHFFQLSGRYLEELNAAQSTTQPIPQNRIDAEEACIDIFHDFADSEADRQPKSVQIAWNVGQALATASATQERT